MTKFQKYLLLYIVLLAITLAPLVLPFLDSILWIIIVLPGTVFTFFVSLVALVIVQSLSLSLPVQEAMVSAILWIGMYLISPVFWTFLVWLIVEKVAPSLSKKSVE